MHHSRTLSGAWNSYTLKGWGGFSINFRKEIEKETGTTPQVAPQVGLTELESKILDEISRFKFFF